MGVHEDILKKGKKRYEIRIDIGIPPIKRDAVYLKKKEKNGLQRNIDRSNK